MSNSKSVRKDQPKLSFSGQRVSTKPPQKRFQPDSSDTSNTSMEEFTSLQLQLETMTESMTYLREDLKSMLKRDEIVDLIKNTVETIMASMELKTQDRVKCEVHDKTKVLTERVEGLEFENKQLKDKLESMTRENSEKQKSLEESISRNYRISREANERSNYNEQYSRKNNVKIMDIKEEAEENSQKLTESVTEILRTQGVTLAAEDILDIHRIPTRKGRVRPILMKLRNNDAKASVMKKRSGMKAAGYRLVDDVTKRNQGLISRLPLHPEIKNAWYFNGSVYGCTTDENRLRFDIHDSISQVISDYQGKKTDKK